jgi:regulation of enolase protein 1 (concanavalin A-like superfamily)
MDVPGNLSKEYMMRASPSRWTPFLLISLVAAAALASASQAANLADLMKGRDYIVPPPTSSGPGAKSAFSAEGSFQALGVAAAPDGAVVAYNSFHDGAAYSMLRFNGRHTSLLVQRKDLERMGIARIRRLIDEQDLLYEAMVELTAGEPAGTDLLTVAVVENTCGGGCGFIGSKGVEILAPVFHQADVMSFVTHEMLHNFDRFSGHLYNGGDIAHAWNAFMDHFVPWYLHKGDLSLRADDVLALKTVEKLSPYENHPGASWSSCIQTLSCDPVGQVNASGMSVLTQGGVLLRIAQLHGRSLLRNWVPTVQNLITTRGLNSGSMTSAQKSDLMIESVGLTLGVDVSCYFDGWNWPVGSTVRSALAAFGTNARCLDADGDGRSEFSKDCNDASAATVPGAVETVNGVDNDCNGAADDLLLAESGDFPGDAPGALAVPLNRRITGRIATSTDADFFRINLPSAGWVRFTVKSQDFSGFFTFHGAEGLRFTYVDTARTDVIKYSLPAGDHVFDMAAARSGNYEVLVQADYAFPMAEDYQPITLTPAPASEVGANQYRLPTPAAPASIAGLPSLTLNWWSSRLGPIVSSIPATAPFYDWGAPAGTDPENLAIRAAWRSAGVPVHPWTQAQSLLGPTPWTSQDIGSTALPGSATNFGEEDFAMRASGADIWNTADAFRFTWIRLNGNAEIKALVLHVQYTHEFAKAGVMFREDLTPGSKNVLAALIAGNQFTFQRRTAAGGTSASTKVTGIAAPSWVRLTRVGDVFRAFRSPDGVAWTEVGNVTLPMTANIYAGLALTSHDNAVLASASFDNLIPSGGAPPTYNLSGRVATSAGAGISGVSITLSGSAAGTASTDADGAWSINTLPAGGNYTVTPSRSGYTFSPTSRTYNNLQANQVADFTGTASGSLPSPWATQDIGAVGLAGSATHSSGTFTVTGAGADIWGTADAFRYVYQGFTGDLDIRARVTSVPNTNVWAKAGVMVRENLGAGSRNVAMVVSAASGLNFQSRAADGGTTTSIKAAGAAPKWVRLVRSGSSLTGYWSDNGTSWTSVGTVTVSMSSTVQVGLAVTSHTVSALCQVPFTNVSVAASSPWTRNDIGAVGVPGTSSVSGTSATVNGSGADIWGTADAFTFLNRPMVGDGSITARVASVQNTNAWAKVGVMIRDGLGAGAMHATMVVTPSNGVAFQRRTATGGSSASTQVTGLAAPYWVRVTRVGNTFTAFRSPDGSAWTQVGSVTIAMPANALMGLAVTSHNNAVLCQGAFSNITAVE